MATYTPKQPNPSCRHPVSNPTGPTTPNCSRATKHPPTRPPPRTYSLSLSTKAAKKKRNDVGSLRTRTVGPSPSPPLSFLALEANNGGRQNNALLDDLASKVTALRGVTVDIYDQARDHTVLNHSVGSILPSSPSSSTMRNRSLTIGGTERGVLFLQHVDQELGRSRQVDGTERRQDVDTPDGGDDSRCCSGALRDLGLAVWLGYV